MSRIDWQQNLLEVLDAHGTKLGKGEVAELNALGDDTPLARWSRKTIKSQNILSVEELKIWHHIKKTRLKHTAVKTGTFDSDVPIDEPNLQHAIESLEASTKSIRNHQEVLKKQQEYLDAFRQQHDCRDVDTSAFQRNLHRKRQAEAQQLKFMVSELRAEVEFRLSLMQGNCEKAVKAIPSVATERLNADDRILEILESLTSDDDQTKHMQGVISKQRRVEQLTTLLQQATVETLKTRLDRIYLEECQNQPDSHLGDVDDERSEAEALKEDLETLYAEIDDVAAMVIQHKYSKPLNTILTATERAQQRHQRLRQEKICGTLNDMTNSLEDLTQRCEQLHSYRVALDQVQNQMTRSHQSRKTPQTRRESNSGKRTSFGGVPATPIDTQPALKALMQHLNIDITKSTTLVTNTAAKATPKGAQSSIGHNRSKSTSGPPFANPTLSLTEHILTLQSENQSLATKIINTTNEAISRRKQQSKLFSTSATDIANEYDDNDNDNISDTNTDGQTENTFATQISQLKQLDILTTQAKLEIENMTLRNEKDGVEAQIKFVEEWQRRKQTRR